METKGKKHPTAADRCARLADQYRDEAWQLEDFINPNASGSFKKEDVLEEKEHTEK
jgi:hypothetical protein